MKTIYLILASFLAFNANAQWSLLYEGGFNTSHGLLAEWSIGSTGTTTSDSSVVNMGYSPQGNRAVVVYYSHDISDEHVFLMKDIPEMADYAALRFYVEMTLPDSIGIPQFYTSANGTDWELFSTDELSQNVPFFNPNGHHFVKLDVSLLLNNSVHFRFDYVRIEADTTAMLGTNEPEGLQDLQLFASGSVLTVNPHTNDSYTFSVTDLAAREVVNQVAEGKSVTVLSELHGIYLVRVSQNGQIVQKKIWLE